MFVDKPVDKQQELTFEQRMAVQSKSVTAQKRINQLGEVVNAYELKQKTQVSTFQDKGKLVDEEEEIKK